MLRFARDGLFGAEDLAGFLVGWLHDPIIHSLCLQVTRVTLLDSINETRSSHNSSYCDVLSSDLPIKGSVNVSLFISFHLKVLKVF